MVGSHGGVAGDPAVLLVGARDEGGPRHGGGQGPDLGPCRSRGGRHESHRTGRRRSQGHAPAVRQTGDSGQVEDAGRRRHLCPLGATVDSGDDHRLAGGQLAGLPDGRAADHVTAGNAGQIPHRGRDDLGGPSGTTVGGGDHGGTVGGAAASHRRADRQHRVALAQSNATRELTGAGSATAVNVPSHGESVPKVEGGGADSGVVQPATARVTNSHRCHRTQPPEAGTSRYRPVPAVRREARPAGVEKGSDRG